MAHSALQESPLRRNIYAGWILKCRKCESQKPVTDANVPSTERTSTNTKRPSEILVARPHTLIVFSGERLQADMVVPTSRLCPTLLQLCH